MDIDSLGRQQSENTVPNSGLEIYNWIIVMQLAAAVSGIRMICVCVCEIAREYKQLIDTVCYLLLAVWAVWNVLKT